MLKIVCISINQKEGNNHYHRKSNLFTAIFAVNKGVSLRKTIKNITTGTYFKRAYTPYI